MNLILATLLIFMSVTSSAQTSNHERLNAIADLSRIAFGSCNKQYNQQVLWRDLLFQSPDLFIWGGDNVYVNDNSAEKVKASYEAQNKIEDYKFFKAIVPILGTWDDHDYGNNNQDGTFPIKKLSRDYALDFYEEPKLSPRRLREGLYASYKFNSKGNKVQIILLDNRYFLHLEKSAPILGSTQWRWLTKELSGSDANLVLIVSSLSVISPRAPGSEEWADFPLEQQRLRKLLETTGKPYLYLTGDKHFSDIFFRNGELEFMSSGMTHNVRLPLRPYVIAKFPDPVFENNYGIIDFNWDNETPILTLTIRTASGFSAHERKVKWSQGRWNLL